MPKLPSMDDVRDRVREALAGRYEIEDEIGRGGMAVVFRAADVRHNRKVAVKVLRPELAAAVGADRFEREIEIAAGLNHPNILAVHDSGVADGLLFYVMPLVDGDSLRERLAREGPLPVAEAERVTAEIADALGYAHERGVVHRDIKPANVLFQAGHALVADFGIARAVETQDGAPLTETGLAVGTIAYMSPEQALGERDLDARTDLYALGCVLYEMLTGVTPFEANSGQGMLAQKVVGRARRPSEVRTGIPPSVDDVVQRVLAREPEDRYATASELSRALRGAITEEAVAAGLRRRRWRGFGRSAAAIVTLAVLAVGGVWFSGRADGPAIRRLAVLPITDFTNTPEQEYLIEGLHQSIITELQQAGVVIIGRRGVLQFAGSDTPVREIARRLDVDAVVDCSLMRSGDTLAIQVGLIDARTEAQIWSADFTEALSDVQRLYRDVTRSITDEIGFAIAPEAEARMASRTGPVDPQEYSLILQGRFNRAKLTVQGIDAAERYFEQALELNPESAVAWAELAQVWGVRMQMGLMPFSEAGPRIAETAERALALDPDRSLAEVQYMLAVTSTWGAWEFEAGTEAYETVLETNPNHAQAAAYFAHHLHIVGQPEEGARMFEHALDLDPDDFLVQVLYGMELMYEGRFDYAVERMEEALLTTPNDPVALSTLRTAYHMTGDHERAIDIWRRSYASQGHPERVEVLNRGWEEGGYSAALRAVAEFMEEEASRGVYVTPWQIGTLYTRAGEEELALDFLERAVEVHDPNVPYLAVDPIFDFMRDNPRFVAIIEGLGLSRESRG